MALHVILRCAEEKRIDIIENGLSKGADGPYGPFSGCFMLFRGARLSDDNIQYWKGIADN